MVTISLGVPEKPRSSRTLPAASTRYWTVMSMGPWPMSAFPCQVPTSVFNRSNSGEPGLGLPGSSAFSPMAAASSNVAQTVIILVFIVFLFLSFWFFGCLSEFHLYDERAFAFGTGHLAFFAET